MFKTVLFIVMSMVSWFGFSAPLPLEQAFPLDVKIINPQAMTLSWQIKPGYFLYSERIKITNERKAPADVESITTPLSENKEDSSGHIFPVYRGLTTITIKLHALKPGEGCLQLSFQGCSDEGFCYPPTQKNIFIQVNKESHLSQALLTSTLTPTNQMPGAEAALQPTDAIGNTLQEPTAIFSHKNTLFILLSFLGLGLLLSFTPCVLPMIPVLSGIIVGHGTTITARKAFLLSLSYVLSMAFTYAIIGAIVAYMGSNLQILMQSTTSILLFSGLFVLLSLSMFGFFDLKLPIALQAKLAAWNHQQAHGHYIGAAIMGCLSTLILSPCVTAPLIGALTYIAQTGNILLGCSALFFLGLGMGAPLLLIGASAGHLLPKAGLWMNTVKAFFGVMLLGVAIYLLSRVISDFFSMNLWAAFCIITGIYMGALSPGISSFDKLKQGVGFLLLSFGLLILVGASMGSHNPLQPLSKPFECTDEKPNGSHFKAVHNLQGLDAALKNARGEMILLDFYASWCTSCNIMQHSLFENPIVHKALRHIQIIKVDISSNNKESDELRARYHVIAPPTFIFLNNQGEELTNKRLVGEIDPDSFIRHIQKLVP